MSAEIHALYLPPEWRNLSPIDALFRVWIVIVATGVALFAALGLLWPRGASELSRRLWLQFEGNLFYVLGWGYTVVIITNLLTLIAWLLYKLVPWQEY